MEWRLELEEFVFAGCMSNHPEGSASCLHEDEVK